MNSVPNEYTPNECIGQLADINGSVELKQILSNFQWTL